MFSDLECDYINPIDLCNKLNQVRTLPLHMTIDSHTSLLSLSYLRTLRTLSLLSSSLSPVNGLPSS